MLGSTNFFIILTWVRVAMSQCPSPQPHRCPRPRQDVGTTWWSSSSSSSHLAILRVRCSSLCGQGRHLKEMTPLLLHMCNLCRRRWRCPSSASALNTPTPPHNPICCRCICLHLVVSSSAVATGVEPAVVAENPKDQARTAFDSHPLPPLPEDRHRRSLPASSKNLMEVYAAIGSIFICFFLIILQNYMTIRKFIRFVHQSL